MNCVTIACRENWQSSSTGKAQADFNFPGLARPSQNPYVLDRVRVDGGEGAAGLAASLAALGLPRS